MSHCCVHQFDDVLLDFHDHCVVFGEGGLQSHMQLHSRSSETQFSRCQFEALFASQTVICHLGAGHTIVVAGAADSCVLTSLLHHEKPFLTQIAIVSARTMFAGFIALLTLSTFEVISVLTIGTHSLCSFLSTGFTVGYGSDIAFLTFAVFQIIPLRTVFAVFIGVATDIRSAFPIINLVPMKTLVASFRF